MRGPPCKFGLAFSHTVVYSIKAVVLAQKLKCDARLFQS